LLKSASTVPEYPKVGSAGPDTTKKPSTSETIGLARHDPYPRYTSSEYLSLHHPVQACYIDSKRSVRAPSIYSYQGLPQYQAEPAIGSYDLLGIRGDVCFDRFGRLGPYGFEKGLGVSAEDNFVLQEGQIDYAAVDKDDGGINWGRAQTKCYEANKARFTSSWSLFKSRKILPRSAVVIRTWTGFEWTELMTINMRAIINELALKSGGEYDVHILMHVKEEGDNEWFYRNETISKRVIETYVPAEFREMVTLWSVPLMESVYTTPFGDPFENSSGQGVHGVYRSLHMSLQWFAQVFSEYEYFWSWEVDVRYTGHYYELFDRLATWGRAQPREGLWQRSAKYYIPALHGTFDNFTDRVKMENAENKFDAEHVSHAGKWPGAPLQFPGRKWLKGKKPARPVGCTYSSKAGQPLCGVGEEADLITLNPMFDPDSSGWILEKDISGYDLEQPIPPRKTAIVAAGRLSKKLLNAMHEEMIQYGHSAFSEMFPPTMALHHGLKAVFAPHPVYLDREWPLEEIENKFNGAKFGSTGGNGSSPYNLINEHNFHGTTWYYSAAFSGVLWRRWLGFKDGGEGGIEYEDSNTGRMCLRSTLLHPIKWEHPE
jgi:hypothetical protein